MIGLTLGEVVAGYTVALSLLLFLAAFVGQILRVREENRRRLRQAQCTLCGEPFEPTSPSDLTTCPACGHPNESRPRTVF